MRIRDGPAAVWEYETGRFQNQYEVTNPHAKEPEVGRSPSQKNCKNTERTILDVKPIKFS